MKKFLSLTMAFAMVLTLLAGCGSNSNASVSSSSSSSSSAGSSASNAEQYTLKMHLSVGTTDPVYSAAEKFAQEVSEKTDGNVTIELYASSSLGNTADCLEGLSMRACDIVFDSISNMSSMTELANIEAAPYMYNSMDHYRAVWEGDVGTTIMKDVGDACGMVILASGLQGVRVMTTNKPVRSVSDVKGLKLRVPTISIYMDTWDWLGASITPLAGSEIFTAIQQGTVDGQENPYASSASLSLYEVCKYVTETNHVYSTDGFIMDSNFFNSLPADYQDALRTSAEDAGKYCTDAVINNAEADKQKFVDAGCEIIETDVSEWQAALDGFLEAKYPSLVEYAQMIADADPAK
jgi:tripartite ATP-independent transporter DctP family solute receptor